MTRKIPEDEDVALLSLWEVWGGELCANAGVKFISHPIYFPIALLFRRSQGPREDHQQGLL